MRIMQIIPDFDLAGAEVMCEKLSYELIKQGQEVLVVSLYNKHTAITERIENAGIKIVYLDKSIGFDLSIFQKLRKLYKVFRPDVIHTHLYSMLYAVPASIGLRVRRIHTVHNIATKEVEPVYQRAYHFFYRFLDVTPVALSALIQDSIEKEYGIPKEKIPIAFNGIDLSNCLIKDNYTRNDEFVFLNIARFSEQKNHAGLIKAFGRFSSLYPDSILWLIGEGELKDDIINQIKSDGLENKILLCGLQDNVYPYLNKADVFVLSSNYEGLPMTLIEAMGSGLPIISTNVGGVPDLIINNESGLLVENDDVLLAKAFEKVYQDDSLRERLGKNAIKRSVMFSADVMATNYVRIYERL